MTTCTYGLARKQMAADRIARTVMVECGDTATMHIVGSGRMPRGLDQQGHVQVRIDSTFCNRHTAIVKKRLDHYTATPLENP